MSALQLIVDRAGYDHFSKLMEILRSDYKKDPQGYYFYLVPNHIKFKSEIKTLEYLRPNNDPYAQINIQILSLTRLGWFFFNSQMMQQHQQISDSGVNMLIYVIIQEHADELPLFEREVNQTGFVLKIAQEINEMQTSQISADDLAKLYRQSTKAVDQNDDLIKKMHDFLIIYKAYEKATKNKYISKPGVLNRLCDYLEKLPEGQMSRYHFYISGFSQFTAQENRLVQILIKRSAGVVIDLDMDQSCISNDARPFDLFYRPQRLYKRLYAYAKSIGINPKTMSISKRLPARVSSDVKQLENYWIDAYQNHVIPGKYVGKLEHSDSIQVIQADNTYSELSTVAAKIRQMVATKKYRYSDFLILTRHLDKFSNVIKPVFRLQQIPIFNDLQKQMMMHPLVRLIGDLFSIYHSDSERNYTYRDVMDLLKTGLLIPPESDGDRMNPDEYYRDLYLCENYVLRNGYWGDEWVRKKKWQFSRYNDFQQKSDFNQKATKRINKIKNFVKDTLTKFFKRLKNAKDCRAAATILYQFLVDNGVVDQLKSWRQDEIKADQLEAAGQNNQVWSVFCNLLDSCVDVLGDKQFDNDFTVSDFWSLLKAGFESTSYSQVPPTFDQVVISESKIVQMRNYKVVFMIGSTDDVMPDHQPNNTLFSNIDRTELKPALKKFNQDNGTQCYLNDGSKYQVNNEPYLNYLAFMSATQKVIFTYSLKGDDEDDGGVKESPYVAHMQAAFKVPTQHPNMTPSIIPEGDHKYTLSPVSLYLGSPLGMLHHLIQALHSVDALYGHRKMNPDKVPLPNDWKYVKELLLSRSKNKSNGEALKVNVPELTRRLLQSVDYTNKPKRLDPKYADQLYTDHLNISISQLETFYQNPYGYFLKYGLDLKPRPILGSSILSDFGQFYHAALKHVLILLKNKYGGDFVKADKKELYRDVDKVVSGLIEDRGNKYEILQSSYRMGYIKSRLSTTIKAMVYTIYLQAKDYTKLRPWQMELPFTSRKQYGDQLSPLTFKVRSKGSHKEHRIQVNGQIDRVDYIKSPDNKRQYFGIVDYKSGPHSFDYGQIYAGTQMQMMTYLDDLYHNIKDHNRLMSRNGIKSYVFGALYSLIQNPLLSPKDIKSFNVMDEYRDDPWKILLQQQKYNGILIDDIGLPSGLIDKSLDPKQYGIPSMMYKSLKRKKSGGFVKHGGGHLITSDEFNVIRKWVEHKIKAAASLIYSGYDDLKPAQWGNHRTSLAYSPYKSIMCFDPLLPDDKYNQIRNLKSPDKLVDAIKQAEDGKDK